METKSEIVSKLKEIKPFLYKEYSVKQIGLFGSFADETNNEGSDIDILVEFEKPIGWRYFTLELYLEQLFGRKVDLVTKNALKDQIKEIILSQLQYV